MIKNIWKNKCKDIVGLSIKHASDGDSKIRQLMLEDYKVVEMDTTEGRMAWFYLFIYFPVNLDAVGDAKGLHEQYFIYNVKIFIFPLDSLVRVFLAWTWHGASRTYGDGLQQIQLKWTRIEARRHHKERLRELGVCPMPISKQCVTLSWKYLFITQGSSRADTWNR